MSLPWCCYSGDEFPNGGQLAAAAQQSQLMFQADDRYALVSMLWWQTAVSTGSCVTARWGAASIWCVRITRTAPRQRLLPLDGRGKGVSCSSGWQAFLLQNHSCTKCSLAMARPFRIQFGMRKEHYITSDDLLWRTHGAGNA